VRGIWGPGSYGRNDAAQLMGLPLKSLQGFGVPAESYGFANKRLAWETIPPLLDRASPLRTAHLRDPVGPQILQLSYLGLRSGRPVA
jgi:hypothetical protein